MYRDWQDQAIQNDMATEQHMAPKLYYRNQTPCQDIREKRQRNERNSMNAEKMKGREGSMKLGEMSPESSKKEKRKLNKRKRRKRMQILKQGINELKSIFYKIYYMGSSFEELHEEIILAIKKIPDESEFVERLNQLIKEYVDDTCEYLDDERNRCLTISDEGEQPKTAEARNRLAIQTKRTFEVEFINAIHEEFSVIRTSSEEIDKMIELYYNFNLGEEVEDSKEMKHPLYKSTFNYMMNNEPKLKNWLQYTDKEFYKYCDESDKETHEKLREMLDIITYSELEAFSQANESRENSTIDSYDRTGESARPCIKKKKTTLVEGHDEDSAINDEILDQQTIKTLRYLQLKTHRIYYHFDVEWTSQLLAALSSKTKRQ